MNIQGIFQLTKFMLGLKLCLSLSIVLGAIEIYKKIL